MSEEPTIEVHVYLLEEGTDTVRPTKAISMGGNIYKLLPTDDYDPEDEIWEFLPGAVVRCKISNAYVKKNILVAYEQVQPAV